MSASKPPGQIEAGLMTAGRAAGKAEPAGSARLTGIRGDSACPSSFAADVMGSCTHYSHVAKTQVRARTLTDSITMARCPPSIATEAVSRV